MIETFIHLRQRREQPIDENPDTGVVLHAAQFCFKRRRDGSATFVSEYDQRTLLGGQFLPRLRTAYSEGVVEEVRRRLHGTTRRTVDGGVVKIRVRY